MVWVHFRERDTSHTHTDVDYLWEVVQEFEITTFWKIVTLFITPRVG